MYAILIVDLSECYCAYVYSDGEIEKKFDMSAAIDRPHKTGGQSAQRFARIRENQITDYFKRINENLKQTSEEMYLGISFVYKNRFLKNLNTYNKAKIKQINNIEYSGLLGVQQHIKMLEKEKGNVI